MHEAQEWQCNAGWMHEAQECDVSSQGFLRASEFLSSPLVVGVNWPWRNFCSLSAGRTLAPSRWRHHSNSVDLISPEGVIATKRDTHQLRNLLHTCDEKAALKSALDSAERKLRNGASTG